jgi:hypothetical protein
MIGVAGACAEASDSMISESPTRSSVWPMLPSGFRSCPALFAPKSATMKLMNFPAPATMRFGLPT